MHNYTTEAEKEAESRGLSGGEREQFIAEYVREMEGDERDADSLLRGSFSY